VAHSLSAKKRVRQGVKRRARNRYRKDLLKDTSKVFAVAVVGGDVAKVEDAFKKVVSRMSKLAGKKTLHKNTVARKRSRLAKKVNAIKSGEGKKA